MTRTWPLPADTRHTIRIRRGVRSYRSTMNRESSVPTLNGSATSVHRAGAWANAVKQSVLAELPQAQLDELLSDALRVDIPAGSTVYREGDAPRCGLLVSGLARVFLIGGDGRQ